ARTLNSGKADLPVDGSSVAFLDAGLHTIKATYLGDGSYNTSSGTFTETVNQVSTSTSVTNDHPSGSVYGEPVTYTATVTSPTTTPTTTASGSNATLSVTFTADDGAGHVTPMGTKSLDSNGKATLSFNALPVGSFTITAPFTGNVNFKGASDGTWESVSQGTTTTSVSTSKSPTVFGEPVTFTATVSPDSPSTLAPKGSVTFIDLTDNNKELGTSNLDSSGKAKLTVTSLASSSTGLTHTIEADYNTD